MSKHKVLVDEFLDEETAAFLQEKIYAKNTRNATITLTKELVKIRKKLGYKRLSPGNISNVIREVVTVSTRTKPVIEELLNRAYELEAQKEAQKKEEQTA